MSKDELPPEWRLGFPGEHLVSGFIYSLQIPTIRLDVAFGIKELEPATTDKLHWAVGRATGSLTMDGPLHAKAIIYHLINTYGGNQNDET